MTEKEQLDNLTHEQLEDMERQYPDKKLFDLEGTCKCK